MTIVIVLAGLVPAALSLPAAGSCQSTNSMARLQSENPKFADFVRKRDA
jgi:hypothetical protein